ncbi:hypothetical protein D0B54_22625 [Solimonas sp. K1W22B-7]|uniref:DUF6691 family protein n=1 Tax=Solimonas sp. K1W22B-7 TaxID=2303331 RepID=UPI000E3305B6|nr:DUF6691 family protein [Solimonas sp. K1W22B-7]AXQ31305.1 hypothetical protein D0B54_22625 [Solimonas sp. K1W22B-7]
MSNNKQIFAAGAAGLLFGFGLILSGMTDPAKVRAFLDITGQWNPALAFVMGGAILAALPAFAWARRHQTTLAGAPLTLPNRTLIDARLVGGAALFGAGWGLSGLCPGPALVVGSSGSLPVLAFIAAMGLGILLSRRFLAPRIAVDPAGAGLPAQR